MPREFRTDICFGAELPVLSSWSMFISGSTYLSLAKIHMFANISIPFESQCSNQHAYSYILVICVSSSPQSVLLQLIIVCSC